MISTALIAIITGALFSLFMVGIKNYYYENQKASMQKELNFVADNLGALIKQAADVPENFDTYNRSVSTLILALPAIDESENFLYDGDNLVYDYAIFYLDNGTLHKKIVPDSNSQREPKNVAVLNDVLSFECTYTPFIDTEEVDCNIKTSRNVGGNTILLSADKKSRLRNKK